MSARFTTGPSGPLRRRRKTLRAFGQRGGNLTGRDRATSWQHSDGKKGANLVSKISRRGFVGQAAVGVAALAAVGGTTAAAQLVYQRSDWNMKEFDELLRLPARAKQVYDVTALDSGKFLNNIKNSLNGLQFGFGIPAQQIRILAGLDRKSTRLNSSHMSISYAVFCLKKKKKKIHNKTNTT